MQLEIVTLADRPELMETFWDMETSWPEFMKHDPIGNGYYASLEEFAEFVLVCLDGSGRMVAKAHSVPFQLPDGELPDAGWDFAIRSGLLTRLWGEEPNAVSAVEIAIEPALQGAGLSGRIVGALREEFDYANVMQVPSLTKIVVNMGVGDAAKDSKLIDGAIRDLATVTGQKPQVTKARKSIAQFKLREGMPIGCHVTLRGDRMWEFADRLLSLALPRIRDFRGLSPKQFDGNGNYTFGLNEQVMFHEIDQDRIDRVRGMDITFVTTATSDDQGRALLRHLGFPFRAN